ncbi:MAG: hypothetical protein KDA61_10490, partial [Planctomycetales bacterium]|nr:hypothetical protein [Planctomycetales bacterium]
MSHRLALSRTGGFPRCVAALGLRVSGSWLRVACVATACLFAGRSACLAPASAQEASGSPAPSGSSEASGAEAEPRLIDRTPFDRLTLKPQAGGETIDVQPLELPGGPGSTQYPAAGILKIYRIIEPSIPYEINWSDVARIDQYAGLILAEAERQTANGDMASAFEDLAFLHRYYPTWPGLDRASQNHLWKDAGTAFSGGRAEEALPILWALYDLNSEYPRLANAVQVISDRRISQLIEQKDFAQARATVDMLDKAFANLSLSNLPEWRNKFAAAAAKEVTAAKRAIAARDFEAARLALTRAHDVWPDAEGMAELFREIQQTAPEIRVGVANLGSLPVDDKLPAWTSVRIAGLVRPRLTQLVDFSAEGGVYASAWGDLAESADGKTTIFTFNRRAIELGVTPAAASLALLRRADPDSAHYDADFAAFLNTLSVKDGSRLEIAWKRPHIRPAALLQAPLGDLQRSQRGPLAYQAQQRDLSEAQAVRYRRDSPTSDGAASPAIVERLMDDDEQAMTALAEGAVDVIERVPPWQLQRVRSLPDVSVGEYRLPTVHVLYLSPDNPLLEMREFRRAICYGIDREQIVRDLLLGGANIPGFRTLSGPFSAGVGMGDPVGYAYDEQLAPRPYQPRLARVLAGVAREAVRKIAERDAAPPASSEQAPDEQQSSPESDAGKDQGASDEEAPAPLRLLHSADPLARLACQSIKLQLAGVGVPIELVEYAPDGFGEDIEFDIAYLELNVGDPIISA